MGSNPFDINFLFSTEAVKDVVYIGTLDSLS